MNKEYETILVTGSSGFIGSNLLRDSLDNNSKNFKILLWSKTHMGSLLEKEVRKFWIKKLRPSIIVNLAWSPIGVFNYQDKEENYLWESATFDFINEAVELGIRFITIGSAKDKRKNDEIGISPYAKSKQNLRHRVEITNLDKSISWLTPEYLFSLKDLRPRLVKDFLETNKFSPENVRNPDNIENFIHINDLISCLNLVISKNIKGILKTGGIGIPVSDFINYVCINLNQSVLFPWKGIFNLQSPSKIFEENEWKYDHTLKFFRKV